MISRRVNGYASYYCKDGHGSVVYGFTEGKWRSYQYDYTAWGEPDAYDYFSPSNPNPIQYCGEYHDAESGLIYLRGRYYSVHRCCFWLVLKKWENSKIAA